MVAGSTCDGRLGNGIGWCTSDYLTPVLVSGGFKFKFLLVGGMSTCGVLVNGSAMCWGATSATA